MGKVSEPPDDVFVLGYSSQKGNASSGRIELFTNAREVVRRIQAVEDDSDEVRNVTIHRLIEAKWEPVTYCPPAPASIVLVDTPQASDTDEGGEL